MKIRTRFAPSPTGFMHIGNLRSALFTYLLSKHESGEVILRIEDTDQTRIVDGGIDFIYDTCNLCNLKFDEGPKNPGNYGPYIQSERKNNYLNYALKLVENDKAYYCFCDENRLDKLREKAQKEKVAFMYDGHCKKLSKEEVEFKLKNGDKFVIRQKMPKEQTTSYEDLVFGKIEVENKILEDQILIKSDGFPTYNFANVIDDHLMDITHITRGSEYLMSTAKYILLYKAFNWEIPKFMHMPTVNGTDGKKLSKRNGDASFMDLYKEGYLPEGIINYLALLGWSPESNKEIYTMDELIKEFSYKRVGKSPAIYDIKKLDWVNAHHIKNLADEQLFKLTIPFLEREYDLKEKDENFIKELILLYKNHLSYGKQIIKETELFFKEFIDITGEELEFLNSDESIKHMLKKFSEILEQTQWDIDSIKEAINITKEETGNKGKLLFMPIRIKITGQMHGPELPSTIYLLGRKTVLNRLSK